MPGQGRKEPEVGVRSADAAGVRSGPRGAIRTWPAAERPREKLLRHGAQR